jgi:23S rRNA (cytidine1920-2'-O)/16S rRNA (cytidine1409-2'-O)-methyltransferase
VTRRRLDTELVRRGLVASRAEAQEAVRNGLVLVSGSPATKVATMVGDDAPIALRGDARRFVSRGGEKLRAALDRFGVDPAGLEALDAGASTGGFTDCLLQAGAARVIAVDVGYGQLAWPLRTDDRVTVMERTNVREVRPESLPFVPSLVVADLSFISLSIVLPTLASVASPDAAFILLVKPQFEAGPKDVGSGGVVRDPAVWGRVLRETVARSTTNGIAPVGLMASPVVGPAGNVEFLLHGRGGAQPATIDIDAVVVEGEGIRG